MLLHIQKVRCGLNLNCWVFGQNEAQLNLLDSKNQLHFCDLVSDKRECLKDLMYQHYLDLVYVLQKKTDLLRQTFLAEASSNHFEKWSEPVLVSLGKYFGTNYFFRLSRISRSKITSSGTGGGGSASMMRILLTTLTIWKITKAKRMKLIEMVMKLP